MNKQSRHIDEPPIDVVIAWVDGSDPGLAEKRNSYLGKSDSSKPGSGAHLTRFASINEIRYCVLSIMKFAPFVRNIYIITDEQDPDLYDDIRLYYPERIKSFRIVDHKEIFSGFEDSLPTFNSISIGNMIWRIKGLSDNFVYFNDDTFLIKETEPGDWFRNGKPVMRGKWVPAPFPRILWNKIRLGIMKHLLRNHDFQPRASFHLGQWNSAYLAGYRMKYFTNSHTPHPVEKKLIEDYFNTNRKVFEKNIAYRFRDRSQFTFIALSNHLQLLSGNRQVETPGVAYLQPYGRSKDYIEKKIRICENDTTIKFLCVQSLDLCEKNQQDEIFNWMEKILGL